MNWKLILAVLLMSPALILTPGGCGGAGRQISHDVPRGIAAADRALNGVDDIARRIDVPEAAIRTPAARSEAAASDIRVVMRDPKLSPEDLELVHEGSCAILDFALTHYGSVPTEEQILTWLLDQGIDVFSPDGKVMLQDLLDVATALEDQQLSTEEYAEVSALVCDVPVG